MYTLYTDMCVCVYIYIHTHTYSSQYGDTGRAEEKKKYGTAVNAASLEVLLHATVGTHTIGSSALPSRISELLNRNHYFWTTSLITAKC